MGANIPLPALGIKPPEPGQSPLEQYAQLMQIQRARQQQQAGQQEIQLRDQQIKDQQATTAALRNWDGKDYDSLARSVLQNGGSSRASLDIQQHGLAVKKQVSDIAATDATTGSKNLESFIGKHKVIGDTLQGIEGVPDDQLQAAAVKAVTDLTQNGIFDPQTSQQLLQKIQATPDVKTLRQNIDQFAKTSLGAKAVAEQESKLADIQKTKAQTAEADANTRKLNLGMDATNPADPNLQKLKYQKILQAYQAKQPVPAADALWAKSYESSQRETSTASDSLGVTTSTAKGPSGLSAAQGYATVGGRGGSSGQSTKDSIVDLIGQYRENPTMIQRLQVKHPEIMSAVLQKYPDFDQTTYNAKNKLITGYTSGTQSKEINAINTAMGHIKNLDDAIDALNNGNSTLLNKIGTAYNINVAGKTPEAAFKLIVNRVGPEISSAYIPTGGGVNERIANQEDFSLNLPPQTLHNNAAITVNMLRSKIGALENQYKNTVGRDDFTQRFITPEAQASLQKMAPRGNGGKTLTMSQLQQAAKDYGISIDEARRQAIVKGYQVTQ